MHKWRDPRWPRDLRRGTIGPVMRVYSNSPHDSGRSSVSIVVLHDDHLTAARGRLVAGDIAEEMGLDAEWRTTLWNVELLDTHFGQQAADDIARADILVVALRGATGFSAGLKLRLRRWL